MSEFTYGLNLPIPSKDILNFKKSQLPLFITQLAKNEKTELTPGEKA